MKKSIAAAISFIVAAVLGIAIVISSAEEPITYIRVVKTKNPIMQNTVVLEDNLYYEAIPLENSTPDMVKNIDEVKGNLATVYIGPNSFLYKYQVDKGTNILGLYPGQVPLRISTDLISFGGARPGDFVDIIVVRKLGTTQDESGNKLPLVESEVLLEKARVINHVFNDGSTKTLIYNQLYGESAVVEVTPENTTVPPMQVSNMQVPAAIDLAVTPEQAKLVDEEVAKGYAIYLRLNPWSESGQNSESGKQETSQQDKEVSSATQPDVSEHSVQSEQSEQNEQDEQTEPAVQVEQPVVNDNPDSMFE